MATSDEITTAERGLPRVGVVAIVLNHLAKSAGGRSRMPDIYVVIEQALKTKLSKQGKASLRETVNRHMVNEGLVYKHDPRNPGWCITPEGRQHLARLGGMASPSVPPR